MGIYTVKELARGLVPSLPSVEYVPPRGHSELHRKIVIS
jgi:hypothetical protein